MTREDAFCAFEGFLYAITTDCGVHYFYSANVQASTANRQPQSASAPGLTALVFGSGDSIRFAASHDEGRTFAPAKEVGRLPAPPCWDGIAARA